MATYEFDGVIIGAGHNAMILASYMAKSGLKVAVLERQLEVGGGTLTEECNMVPGFYHNMHSVFHRRLTELPWYKDLELDKFGCRYVWPPVNNGVAFQNGKCLVFHKDHDVTLKSIGRFSKKDAEAFDKMYTAYQEMGRKIWFVQDYSPPIPREEAEALLSKSKMGREYLEFNKTPARDLLYELYESREVRVLGMFLLSIRGYTFMTPGTGFSVAAMSFLGNKAYLCVGGSHNLAHGLARSITARGSTIREQSEVNRIIVEDGVAKGVELMDGNKFMAKKFVASSVDPLQTFLRFVGPDYFDRQFVRRVKHFKFATQGRSFGCLITVHAGVNQPPNYKSAEFDPLMNQSFNTCIGYEDPDQFVKHLEDTINGILPDDIGLQCDCPTIFDPTQAPPGKHALHAWQFVPFYIKNKGPEAWNEVKWDYLDRCLERWGEYAPNVDPKSENVIYRFPYTPYDVSRHCTNMLEGDMHAGALIPGQLTVDRPFTEVSSYRTQIKNLYLTGASTHPTGNITGAPGYNSARVIAEDLGIDVWWNPPDPRKTWSELE